MSGSAAALDAPIFDLDGTLWDTRAAVAEAWTNVVRRMGQPRRTVTPEEIGGVMGKAHRELCDALLPGLPPEDQDAIARACYAEEARCLMRGGGRLFAGVADGLTTLAERWPLYIVSNCQSGYIEVFLSAFNLHGVVTDHLCHGDTGRTKAENLVTLMERNRVRNAVYVGDTDGDRMAAEQAGIPFVHAAYGFGTVKTCEHRVDSFTDLADWLLFDRGVRE